MKIFKKTLVTVVIVVSLLYIYDYQNPITVVDNPNSLTVGFVNDLQSLEKQVYEIPESKSRELFNILNKYDTKRMSNPYPYQMDKIDFEYHFQDGERTMHLIVGEDNFVYDSGESKFYEIVNGDELNTELKQFFMQLNGYRRNHTAYLYEGIEEDTYLGVDVGNYKDRGQITWYGVVRNETSGKVFFDGTMVLDYLENLPLESNELNFSIEVGKSESVPLTLSESGANHSVGSVYFVSNYDYAIIMLNGIEGWNSKQGITIVNELYESEDVNALIEKAGLN